jgi:hypothetical protein
MNVTGDGAYSPGGSWNLFGDYEISGDIGFGIFYQTVSSTGTYNLSGSYTGTSPAILPGLATFK